MYCSYPTPQNGTDIEMCDVYSRDSRALNGRLTSALAKEWLGLSTTLFLLPSLLTLLGPGTERGQRPRGGGGGTGNTKEREPELLQGAPGGILEEVRSSLGAPGEVLEVERSSYGTPGEVLVEERSSCRNSWWKGGTGAELRVEE